MLRQDFYVSENYSKVHQVVPLSIEIKRLLCYNTYSTFTEVTNNENIRHHKPGTAP